MSLNDAPTPTPPSVGGTLFAKYAAALLPAAGILLGVLQVILADNLVDEGEGGQLIALVAGLVLTFGLPLLKSWRWAGALKTGAAVLAAVATLIVPLFTGLSLSELLVFLLAVVNAIAVQIGVDMRKDVATAQRVPVTVSVKP